MTRSISTHHTILAWRHDRAERGLEGGAGHLAEEFDRPQPGQRPWSAGDQPRRRMGMNPCAAVLLHAFVLTSELVIRF